MELASYAMRAEQTEGRRYLEESHPYRSEYQRDRDRIVHTKAFRRLEHKTQVFDLDYSDHFRNRLTHTLEVSQIARTVSQALRLNGDLCEVLALSHDIGHPPFSHEGERVLDTIMRRFGRGFDHNLHALRIVEYFEEKYASFRGLNLTFEVREGIIKHSCDYSETDPYYLELMDYRLSEKPTLEGQLIDLVDEIAYNTADLDDGYNSGLLTLDQIRTQVNLFRSCYDRIRDRFPEAPECLRMSETVRQLVNLLVTDLIDHTRKMIHSQAIDSVDKVRRCRFRLVGFSEPVAKLNAQLKRFLCFELYNHPVINSARHRAHRLIRGLFKHYAELPRELPQGHYSRIGQLPLEQVVCDYIAGMTDKFAQICYERVVSGSAAVS